MSKRLECIASKVRKGIGVADVGTDHAYIPLLLLEHGYMGNIVATDIHEGPLNKARQNLCEHDAESRVRLYLCDGLELCPQELVDDIIIAGMGGDVISSILDRTPWCLREDVQLILQPVTKPEILRYWLINNGFAITDEAILKENNTIYQIITAKPGKSRTYSDSELFTGRFDMISNDPLFKEHIDSHIKRFKKATESLSTAKREDLAAWNGIINGMLIQLNNVWSDAQ